MAVNQQTSTHSEASPRAMNASSASIPAASARPVPSRHVSSSRRPSPRLERPAAGFLAPARSSPAIAHASAADSSLAFAPAAEPSYSRGAGLARAASPTVACRGHPDGRRQIEAARCTELNPNSIPGRPPDEHHALKIGRLRKLKALGLPARSATRNGRWSRQLKPPCANSVRAATSSSTCTGP